MTFSPAPKPLPRVPKARKPMKAKNAKRSASEFTRTLHSEARITFVHMLPCIVPGCGSRAIECAHVGNDGAGRKAHYTRTVPLCAGHHRTRRDALHALGIDAFEAEHLVDLMALCADTERCWRRYAGHQPAEAP